MATWEQVGVGSKKLGTWEPVKPERYRVRYRDNKNEGVKPIPVKTVKAAIALVAKIDLWKTLNPGVAYPRDGAPKAAPPTPPASAWTAAKEWLLDLGRTKKPRTVTLYARALKKFVGSLGGNSVTIERLNAKTITAWDVARKANGVGDSTRDMEIGIANSWWKWCIEQQLPGAQAYVSVKRPGTCGRPACAPKWEEMQACVAVLATVGTLSVGKKRDVKQVPTGPGTNPHRRAVIGYFSALRTFQVSWMVYKDRLSLVNPDDVAVIVDLKTDTMQVIKGKMKSESEMRRVVPLAKEFAVWLHAWHDADPSEPRVVASVARDAKYEVAALSAAWELAAKAGRAREEVFDKSIVTGRLCRSPAHAFRRGFVSCLKKEGADSEAVEYLVGHKMPGVRNAYLDSGFLDLVGAVDLIPSLTQPTSVPSNVVMLLSRTSQAAAK